MLSFIDINADPFIEELIRIPKVANEQPELSYEVASATVPFLDSTHYLKMSAEKSNEREIGVSNFFKT